MDEKTLNELKEIAQTLDNASAKIWQTIGQQPPKTDDATLPESNFSTLKFEPQRGVKLGDFEVAHKAANLENKWSNAYNILRVNNSTIESRYHGKDYQYSYWLFGSDKIYRQKLTPNVRHQT